MSGLAQKATPPSGEALVRPALETGHLCVRHLSQQAASRRHRRRGLIQKAPTNSGGFARWARHENRGSR
jgi:hypothetical protein